MNSTTQVSLDRLPGHRWCQCFAIWVDDGLRGGAAVDFYNAHVTYFREQLARYPEQMAQVVSAADITRVLDSDRVAAILAVEGGGALGGDLKTLDQMYTDGVRLLTLTWNGHNELAGGQLEPGEFTDFGRAAVVRMERLGIIADVSHLCEEAFWELDRFATRPFVATHSNSRALRDHPRNLTDDQIVAIARRGGLVSTTFYTPFLTNEPDGDFDCLLRHLERIVQLGGEETPAVGGDFDGGVASGCFPGVQVMPALYHRLGYYFGEPLANRILGGNALDFFERYERSLLL